MERDQRVPPPESDSMGRDDQGITNSKQRWHTIPRVLAFVTHGDGVLLLRGAPTKRIWANRLNGVGGHVERGEDIRSAVEREILEETGLTIINPELVGVVHIDSGADAGIVMFVWRAAATMREVRQTSDGMLEWHSTNQLPTADLVDDLAVLLPKVLQHPTGQAPFFAHYSYDNADRLCIRWHGVEQTSVL